MFDLDHVQIMEWITGVWSMINTGGYAVVIINFICGLGIFLVFRAVFSGDDGGSTDG